MHFGRWPINSEIA